MVEGGLLIPACRVYGSPDPNKHLIYENHQAISTKKNLSLPNPTLTNMKMKYQNRISSKLYFVTFTVVDWIDIFSRPCYKHIMLESLEYCQKHKGLILYGWV